MISLEGGDPRTPQNEFEVYYKKGWRVRRQVDRLFGLFKGWKQVSLDDRNLFYVFYSREQCLLRIQEILKTEGAEKRSSSRRDFPSMEEINTAKLVRPTPPPLPPAPPKPPESRTVKETFL